ncbi:MAG: substrate-binding domain-containing protein [Gammaproteobacteria bacterium]
MVRCVSQPAVSNRARCLFDKVDDTLSIPQLKEIYQRGGAYVKWSDLGLTVPGCNQDKIVVVSRQNNSGTYAYFREAILGKSVVDLVEKTPCAIGYSGLAYATDHIKMACIEIDEGGSCIAPSVSTASDRSYPIARPLFMYTNGEPEGAVKAYLDWILSDDGQCILVNKGYAPVKEVACDS